MERVILHCDMNNYFATVEEKFNPSLRRVPFAVCGDPEMRHSIVLAKNALAKQAGVISGISFRQAKEICPELEYVKAEYPKYLNETKRAREIYRKYTDAVIPYGLDEAWLDLTQTDVSMNDGRQIADLIRIEIMYSQGLSASVGVSDNLIFAKLGSDFRKPNATTVITKDNYRSIVWPLPVSGLLFVGDKRKKILGSIGIKTIGDLARADAHVLRHHLGKVGEDLHRFANGDDSGFSPESASVGSIGNTITPPADLRSAEDASAVLYLVACSVSARLKKHRLKAYCIRISVKDNRFNTFTRQCTLPCATDDADTLFNRAYALFARNYSWADPLRSVGICADRLVFAEFEQLSLPGDGMCAVPDIDSRVKKLTERIGKLQVEKTQIKQDW